MSTVLTVMLFGNINAEAASLTSQQKKIYKECMSDYLKKQTGRIGGQVM